MSDLRILVVVLVMAMLGPFAADSYLPSLPDMTKYFFTTDSVMKLTITLYLLGFSVSQLIYGPYSDRFGRRNVILVGMVIAVLGSIFCFLASSITLLIMGRFVQGAGIGVCNSVFRAVMR